MIESVRSLVWSMDISYPQLPSEIEVIEGDRSIVWSLKID